MDIIHFLKSSVTKSSRVRSQLEMDGGKAVDLLSIFDLKVLKSYKEGSVFIFHQHAMLFNLFIFYFIFKVILRKKVRIIFDLHDLNEITVCRNKVISLLYLIIHEINERLVFLLPGVEYITVSRGLKLLLYKKHRKELLFLPSVAPPIAKLNNDKKGETVVYVGLINEERLGLNLIDSIIRSGLKLEMYGDINTAKPEYLASLLNEREDFVSYKGEFISKNAVSIISNYKYSLVSFTSLRTNIRFCLPNKFYQSIASGATCIVSNNLREINICYNKSNFIIPLNSINSSYIENNSDISDGKSYLKLYQSVRDKYLTFLKRSIK